MNTTPIIDPLQGDFPEVIEEYLQHGSMKCIAFNRRGTLLAAGCNDGSCIIWDFETRGIAKELRDNGCSSPITSICWSKCGNRILASAADKSLSLWDVVSGNRITRVVLQQTPLQVRLHPGSSPPLCLACPLSCAPIIVDLNTGNTTSLKVSVSEISNGSTPASRNKWSDGTISFTPTAACFSKYGNLVYLGNSKGEILVIDHKYGEVRAMVPISSGSVVKNIVFSRNGQYLLTNSNDRVIRIYENLLPLKDEVRALDDLNERLSDQSGVEKLKGVGSKCLTLFREFQDAITKVHWKAPCFSGDGEWVVSGSASKGEHKIYIWDRAGHLVKILEGPKEALIDLAWHPVRPIVVSVSLNGIVYIWAKDYTENWSAFAPDFKELEENEEYVEREDEFDLNPDTEKVKGSDANGDEEVDIVALEKDPAFSDSDMSQEELCFLPPTLDVAEQQEDKFVESSSKMVDSNNSGSPRSEEAEPNGHTSNNVSIPVEDDAGGTHIKRKRKLSEKVLELQAEKVKKPSKSSKTSKSKSKSLFDQDNNGNDSHGDQVSD
ncbi:PREDICTED: protein RBL-like isoform X1 [Lupinus angustifolius]|uniref:protein RBL-like isoform X1 n=2 Tax=Lupinus angustifolius TaxID=3871 RepID=UPI00092EA0F5|nr:PREDICTED: protein RBL-like isoform X1 [Lupinus angustifolius]